MEVEEKLEDLERATPFSHQILHNEGGVDQTDTAGPETISTIKARLALLAQQDGRSFLHAKRVQRKKCLQKCERG